MGETTQPIKQLRGSHRNLKIMILHIKKEKSPSDDVTKVILA